MDEQPAVTVEQAEAATKAVQAALREQASTWDADEWLRGANLPTRSVTLYGRADLAAAIDASYAAAQAAAARTRTYSDPARKQAQADYEALCEEYESSRKVFTVRARKPGDQEAVAKAMKGAGEAYTPERALVYATAQYLTDPVLTVAQVELVAEKLGSAQFDLLCEAWLKLSSETAVPSVPLSSRLSGGRATQGS